MKPAYLKLLERLESGTTFEDAEPVAWQCRRCGFVITSKAAPKRCPVCGADQAGLSVRLRTIDATHLSLKNN